MDLDKKIKIKKRYSLEQIIGFIIFIVIFYHIGLFLIFLLETAIAKFKSYYYVFNPIARQFNVYFQGNKIAIFDDMDKNKNINIEETNNGVDFYIYKIQEPHNKIIIHCQKQAGCDFDYSK